MAEPTSYDELAVWVRAAGGVYHTEAESLRNLEQVHKLGNQIRIRIQEQLAERGLATLPQQIPPSSKSPVILYEANGSLAAIVEAIFNPSEDSAKTLRAVAGDNSREILERIRDLVTSVVREQSAPAA